MFFHKPARAGGFSSQLVIRAQIVGTALGARDSLDGATEGLGLRDCYWLAGRHGVKGGAKVPRCDVRRVATIVDPAVIAQRPVRRKQVSFRCHRWAEVIGHAVVRILQDREPKALCTGPCRAQTHTPTPTAATA